MKIITTDQELENMKSRDLVALECLQCNIKYTNRKKDVLENSKKGALNGCFCSRKCAGIYKQTIRITTTCNQCNSTIIKLKKEYDKSEHHFCNNSCSATYWNSKKWPIENRYVPTPSSPAEKVELTCSTCHKSFTKYKSYLKSCPVVNGCRFCSRKCQAIYANRTWNRSGRFGINKSRCETILRDIIIKEFPKIGRAHV